MSDNTRIRERCACGAEFEVEHVSQMEAERFQEEWRKRHRTVCQDIAVDKTPAYAKP